MGDKDRISGSVSLKNLIILPATSRITWGSSIETETLLSLEVNESPRPLQSDMAISGRGVPFHVQEQRQSYFQWSSLQNGQEPWGVVKDILEPNGHTAHT